MRWVITGASRGIGLEMVKQLAARGDTVEAGARDPKSARELAALVAASGGRVRAHACDVTSDASVRAFAKALGDDPVDVLVNNAGVMGKRGSLTGQDFADVLATYDTNAVGPLRVTAALLPLILKGGAKRIVHITSGMGSIAENTSGGSYGYRMSKAALNMMNKSLSVDLRGDGVTAIVMNPGWVETDMGGKGAPVKVHESVSKMLALIDALRPSDTGAFMSYGGDRYPY